MGTKSKELKALVAYLSSDKGRRQIHGLITTGLVIYVTLHGAGVL
jgi:hypothetical protein